MPNEGENILIEVQFDTGASAQELSRITYQLQVLKDRQKELKREIDAGNDATGEMAKQYAEAGQQVRTLTATQKALTGQLNTTTNATVELGDSFREMDAACRELENQYKSLTKAQRESEEGIRLREKLIETKKALKDFDAELGNHQRNVGNYQEAIEGAAQNAGFLGRGFSGMIGPMRNATGAMRAMSATPLIAVLGAIVLVLQKLGERFRNNAAAMEKLTAVFGVFSGIGEIVNKLIGKIAEGVGWLADKILALADKWGLLTEEMKAGQEIALEDLEIQKAQREAALKTAEDQKKIAELRAEAQNTDKHTASERLQMLQQANDLEEAIFQRTYELAKREYELQVKRNAQSESSQEDLKKENDLKIAMINAETALFDKRRALNKAMSTLRAQEMAEIQKASDERNAITREAAIQHMEDLRLIAEAEAQTAVAQWEELREQAQALLEGLDEREEEEEIPTLDEQALNMFGLDSEGVEYFKKLLDEGVEFSEAKTKALKDQWQRNAIGITQSIGNIGKGFEAVGDILGEFAEESEGAAKAQKAFAFIGIIANQAQSISEGALALAKGIESASGLPFPANIPAIVSITATIGGMLAGIASSIAQAKQIFSQSNDAGNFATGGVIGGNSYTGDRLIAHVNSGEGIYTGTQANNILQEIANNPARGGIDYEAMTASFAAALTAMPAPKMVYSEFNDFTQEVATYDELTAI